jgi:hypothetical protein
MFGAAKAQQKMMQDLPTQFMQVGNQLGEGLHVALRLCQLVQLVLLEGIPVECCLLEPA